MSSLVMLGAIPLLNNNNSILNAAIAAQGYDSYGDSYYSQYPTDDKKYECRTGPFEGFFVSSVEFCKFNKFDDKDRKDISRDSNRTGPQGLPGPNQINQSLLYRVQGPDNTTNNLPLGTADSIANCDMGDVAIGGKFNLFSAGRATIGDLRLLAAGISENLTSYESFIQTSLTGSGQTIPSTVVCFDNPPLRP